MKNNIKEALAGLNATETPQGLPIPGRDMVENNAGGFVFKLDEWKQLERFLILGSEGGTYYVSAEITDDKGRKNSSRLTLWVAGGKLPPERELKQGQVTLIPDKKEYKAGELNIGKSKKKVTSQKQAVAIALSEQRKAVPAFRRHGS